MSKGSTHFQAVKVCDSTSQFNGKQVDVLVRDGVIEDIAATLSSEGAELIKGMGLMISPGIFDMQVSGGEPGEEEKETFQSLNDAALAGGITDVLLMPSFNPAIDNRAQVEYLLNLSASFPVNMFAAGALSLKNAGKDLAELVDMKAGGAISFTDDKNPLNDTNLLHLALQYIKISGGLISVHAEDSGTRLGGVMNEGIVSVQLGLKGAPALSEELGLMRAIALSGYHRQPLHINGISTKGAVDLVRKAKYDGIPLTASVYAHHLYFTEEELLQFGSAFKVWPPLRTQEDQDALLKGLSDGTIDVICSDHRPETRETKDVEFEFAAYGMAGLESLFGAARHASKQTLNCEALVDKLCHAPRRLLGREPVSVSKGSAASFFLYTPDEEFTFEKEMIRSKAINSPFPGKKLTGRIHGTNTRSGWFTC